MRNIIFFHDTNEYYGFFSNWYLSEFSVDGKILSSMEQHMMYCKATLFCDSDIAAQIMLTTNTGKIKSLGRQIENYNNTEL